MSYNEFLERKSATAPPEGIEDIPPLGDFLFQFQSDLVGWALRRGKAALFEAVGLGKTRQELAFAEQASAYLAGDGRPDECIILTPLAVAAQTVREAEKIGIPAAYCKTPDQIRPGIVSVTNYDRIDAFLPVWGRFGVLVLDESSVIKHAGSKRRNTLINAGKSIPFRLAATATPAPNDRKELGNHAEFLGVMTMQEMLSEFFVHDSGKTSTWRLKGHAEEWFWRWIASWGAVVSMPSDLGYSDEGYNIPPLRIIDHVIPATLEQDRLANSEAKQLNLIPMPATNLKSQRRARRATLEDRVKAAVDVVMSERDEQWIVWCELNDEADALEDALVKQIPGAVEIRGADSADAKEAAVLGFASGSIQTLITKPSIAGFGVNWQNCARAAFVGASHKFEEVHQSLGRNHRFGQKREVHGHFIYSALEGNVRANYERKRIEFHEMQRNMRGLVAEHVRSNVKGSRTVLPYEPTKPMGLAPWVASEAP